MGVKTHITLGKVRFSIAYLKSVVERVAISEMRQYPRDTVVNAWKSANGLSVKNYAKKNK